MSIEKKIGGLYQLKSSVELGDGYSPRFCLVLDVIQNQTFWKDRFPVNYETLPLMLVKSDMDLTPDTAMMWSLSSAMAAHPASNVTRSWVDYNLARDQWEEDRCIPGSVFFTPDGKTIWISDIDFKHFEEVEL